MQELLHSLLDPRDDHEPLVVAKVTEGESYDSKIRLVHLWCAPCESFVGWVASWEVGDRLPDYLPYYIVTSQIPDTATETEGALPEYRRCRVLLGDADDPWLQQLMNLHRLSPPDELTTYCRVHGALPFTRRQVLGWAKEARKRILDAEQRGDTPKATRRGLRPPHCLRCANFDGTAPRIAGPRLGRMVTLRPGIAIFRDRPCPHQRIRANARFKNRRPNILGQHPRSARPNSRRPRRRRRQVSSGRRR